MSVTAEEEQDEEFIHPQIEQLQQQSHHYGPSYNGELGGPSVHEINQQYSDNTMENEQFVTQQELIQNNE